MEQPTDFTSADPHCPCLIRLRNWHSLIPLWKSKFFGILLDLRLEKLLCESAKEETDGVVKDNSVFGWIRMWSERCGWLNIWKKPTFV